MTFFNQTGSTCLNGVSIPMYYDYTAFKWRTGNIASLCGNIFGSPVSFFFQCQSGNFVFANEEPGNLCFQPYAFDFLTPVCGPINITCTGLAENAICGGGTVSVLITQ
jgi:hypothetical protein